MTQESKSIRNPNWQPMPAGTLKALAFRLKLRRRIQVGLLAGIILTGILAIILPQLDITTPLSPLFDSNYGDITCTEVRRALASKGKVSPEVQQKMQEHLLNCRACQKRAACR